LVSVLLMLMARSMKLNYVAEQRHGKASRRGVTDRRPSVTFPSDVSP